MIVSAALAIRDEPETHRKKQGDIIAIAPENHQWGTMEKKLYLIVKVDLHDISILADARKLQVEYLPNYELWYPSEKATRTVIWEKGKYTEENVPAHSLPQKLYRLAKRRYRVPFANLKALMPLLKWSRVEDTNDSYQPPQLQGRIFPCDIIEDKANGPLNHDHLMVMREINK